MKLKTKVALSEPQKAQIVARGEELQNEYTFEMTRIYATVFSRLSGYYAYRVQNDKIIIDKLGDLKIASYNYDGYISEHATERDFTDAIAQGSLHDGGSCDEVMQRIVDLLDAKEVARNAKIERDEESAKQAEKEKHLQDWRAKEHDRKQAQEKAEHDVETAARKASKESAAEEKHVWIGAHGSERLRRGHAAGYNCQKLYVYERGKVEIGDEYILDYDSDICTKDRSCPSSVAMDEVDRVSSRGIKAVVVWLPSGIEFPDEDDYYLEPVSCEAVEVVLLGNYFYKEIE